MFPPDSQPTQPDPNDLPDPGLPDPNDPNDLRDPDVEQPLALVHLGARHWVLEPGQTISFGRGSPCDIRLAHDPVDEHVSRRAGVVEHQGEDLVVRNESATRRLIFSPARGPERVLRPGEAITCLPHREFLVALDGRGGTQYVIQVSAPAIG
jgi:hypothetical protein